jgi:hypothetical protein
MMKTTLGGVSQWGYTWNLLALRQSANIRKGEIPGVAPFFWGIYMLSLPMEFKTEIHGDGSGFICITQNTNDGSDQKIWLTVHQFIAIVSQEGNIVREALGTE